MASLQVTDYLTQFSGIQPLELDPNTSTKHLTTLKSTYQKLRCLLDIGVVFVGHGLKKDFKVINMQVGVPSSAATSLQHCARMPLVRACSHLLQCFYSDAEISVPTDENSGL